MSLPWETIARKQTNAGALELRRRGNSDFLITIAGRILMTSSAHRSEDALATLACREVRGKPQARVLVSGLGMGFTLRAALDSLGKDALVTVVELDAIVTEWCQGPLAALTSNATLDPRVTVVVQDVSKTIEKVASDRSAPRFDAIVLDMYEGPHHAVSKDDPLYGARAILRTRQALTNGGIFAIWCEGPSDGFERSLKAAGFEFQIKRAGKGARIHSIYLAKATVSSQGIRRPPPKTKHPTKSKRA